jgi:protein TonB
MISNLKTPFAVSLVLHGAAVFAAAAFFAGGARYTTEITPIEIVEVEVPASQATAQKKAAEPEKMVKKETVKKEAPLLRPSPPDISDPVEEPQKESPQTTAHTPSAHQEEEAQEAAEIKTESAPTVAAQAKTDDRPVTGLETPGRLTEDEMGHFMAMARNKIEKVKSYPRWARERGFEGVVGVRFVINPDGTVDEVKVVRPCHCEVLNRAACESIKKASPFGPLPPGSEGKEIAMEIDIGFRLE